MKIVSHQSRNNACFWYREKIPFDALNRKGFKTSHASDGEPVDWDVDCMHFSRGYPPPIEKIVYALKEQGIKIWYDLDDAMDLVDKKNPFYFVTKTYMSTVYLLLHEADFITVATPALKEHIETLTKKPVEVFGNFLNPTEWKERKESGEKLRIGFAGSASHLEDVNFILPVIEELQKKYDFTFVVMGFDIGAKDADDYRERNKKQLDQLWDVHPVGIEVEKFVNGLNKVKHEWADGCRWELYPRKLAELGLDIALCPLLDTPFNRNKSAIKFYENAYIGTPVICSNVTPFKEEIPGKGCVDNEFAAWYDAIEAMILYPELRAQTLKDQRDYVIANKLIDNNINTLENILTKWIPTKKNS
jgi:glycosyltransferase involved in cell wall biosynthesis